jgi:hypothetical protein
MNRAWTYIISKPLSEEELKQLTALGKAFVNTWTAHDQQLTAEFSIFKARIIVVKVNEDVHSASGCSIDKLVRFMKEVENKFNIELLNRLLVAYKQNEAVEVVHASNVKELLEQNRLNETTIVFNTSVANEQELKDWEQPLRSTWLNKYLTST